MDRIGLIPAAGKGLRLGLPYPKELYPVIRDNHYKPVAQFIVENLISADISHIVFVINETKHQLLGYFGDGRRFGGNFSYVVQELNSKDENSPSPGLAHALDSAYHLTRGKEVFFGMADTIIQPKNVFYELGSKLNCDDEVLLALFLTDQPQKFGMVDYDDNGLVQEIVDKPKLTHLKEMWGCMIWRPQFTDFLHRCILNDHIYDFAKVLNLAIHNQLRIRAVRMETGTYLDLGTYDEIMQLDHHLRDPN